MTQTASRLHHCKRDEFYDSLQSCSHIHSDASSVWNLHTGFSASTPHRTHTHHDHNHSHNDTPQTTPQKPHALPHRTKHNITHNITRRQRQREEKTKEASPSRLNRTFANDGTKIAKYCHTVNMVIEITFNVPSDGLRTPRTCLLRAVIVLPCSSPDKNWNHDEELKGWGLWECPLLLLCSACDDVLSDV